MFINKLLGSKTGVPAGRYPRKNPNKERIASPIKSRLGKTGG